MTARIMVGYLSARLHTPYPEDHTMNLLNSENIKLHNFMEITKFNWGMQDQKEH